jgi:hypothetical protein
MNPTLRNILAVVVGLVLGSIVNMSLIMISGSIIAPPEGADVTTMEGLKASMHLFEPKHFLFPFLAHALGTLVGAWIACMITTSSKMRAALIISCAFLVGGIANVVSLPSPVWFSVLDIVGAYIPMGYIGYRLASKSV